MKKVAIIGMGCRFPGNSDNVEAYWEMLKSGKDCITEIPKERWSIEEYYNPNGVKGKSKSKCGGFINHFDEFDAKFFGMNAREVEQIDPQQRHAVEIVWEALEDAGIRPESLAFSNTGVFVGGFTLDYKIIQFSDVKEIDAHATVGSMMNMLSNRISYVYNLMGPSMTIDTACSSSLVALHTACLSLKNGECDLAIAGGIELTYTPEYYVAESTSGMLSKDGKCKTFDESANGYVRGEGGGFLVLKPLEQAINDGDYIYAVIRESLVNQDGKTNGITVPNKEAQKELLKAVYQRAEVNPSDVQYVELHGTGTGVGDPIETNAVGEFFGETRTDDERLIIASVKSNIGHLEASSGVASVIKVACMLDRKQIVPHIGMKKINPKIDLDTLKMRIPLENEKWPEHEKLSIAGVNSFGFGGTNAHVILEGFENKKMETEHLNKEMFKVLKISAKSQASLNMLSKRYLEFLKNTDEDIDDIAYSAIYNREQMPFSLVAIGENKDELISNLENHCANENDFNVVTGQDTKDKRLVFVFTGMGPQWYAMGRELYHTNTVFKETVDKCQKEFSKYLTWSLIDEFLTEESESRIQYTEVSQPLNFTIQVALFNMWESIGVTPDAIIGHSVGEVAALYCAGVYSFEDAIKISYIRSSLQQRLTGKGGMIAVGIKQEEAEEYIKSYKDKVSVGAINSNTSLTLSGDNDCLKELQKVFDEKGIFNKFLRVTVPYHSLFMNEIKDDLIEGLKDIKPHKSKIRIFTTADGKESEGNELDNNYWWSNVVNSVYFAKAMSTMLDEGYSNFVEIGPHPVLSNSINELAFEKGMDVFVTPTIRRFEAENRQFYKAFASLCSKGIYVNWDKFFDGTFKSVKIPNYAWNHEKYWNEPERHMKRRLGQKEHRFLGYKANSIIPTWEVEVNDVVLPFVKDHCVNGKVLIAGAHYVEASLQAIRNACQLEVTENYKINNIQFHKALFMNEDNLCHMVIQYNPETGKIMIGELREGNKVQNVNFTAECTREYKYAQKTALLFDTIKGSAKSVFDHEDCYAMLTKMNFNYGPMFQGLKKVWIGENEILAQICPLSEMGIDDMDNIIHPSILDAAFQSFLANQFEELEENGSVDLKLPESIESITVYGKIPEKIYAYSMVKEYDASSIIGDIKICDENGSVVAYVKNFVARTMEKSEEETYLGEKELNEWFYNIHFVEQERENDEPLLTAKEEYQKWIILGDSKGRADQIAKRLIAKGNECQIFFMSDVDNGVENTVSVNDPESYEKIVEKMDDDGYGFIYMANMDVCMHEDMDTDDIEKAKGKTLNGIRNLITKLIEEAKKFRVWVVTQNAVKVKGEDEIDVLNGSIIGMLRVISHCECIGNVGSFIDVDCFDESVDLLFEDIMNYTREDQLAYRDGKRYVARLDHVYGLNGNIPVRLYDNKQYIVTGATGSLGQITVNWMYEKGARNFVMIGRTPLLEGGERKNMTQDYKYYSQVKYIEELEKKGCRVQYVAMDITDAEAVKGLVEKIHDSVLPIGGVVHIAGVVRDKMMFQMTQEDFDIVYNTKVKGAWLLSKYLWDDDLDFFMMYSSTGSVVTAVGQVNYAAGNSFLDSLAYYRKSCGKTALSLGWGPWGVGMVKEKNLIDHYKYQRGMDPIYAISGMQALERIFGQNVCHAVIGKANWPLALKNYPGKPALYNHLAIEKLNDFDQNDEEIDLFEKLAVIEDEGERMQLIMDFISGIVAETVHAKKEEIVLDQAINAIGVDSIIATELRNRINKACCINLSIVDILSGISITQIAEKHYEEICQFLEDDDEDDLESLLAQIENISEEEVEKMLNE